MYILYSMAETKTKGVCDQLLHVSKTKLQRMSLHSQSNKFFYIFLVLALFAIFETGHIAADQVHF